MAPPQELRRILPWWQIVLLTISGIIGVTIFSTIGSVLHTASTVGTLLAMAIVGLITICVMASLGELVVLWPVPNALVEYVNFFIDKDLSIVVGITYWYTWSSVFTVLLIAAYDFLCVFLETSSYRAAIFIIVGFCLIVINGLGVKLYGWIEAVGGVIKFVCVVAGGLFLCVALGKEHAAPNPAFGTNPSEARSWFVALCMAIPTLTYGFLGVEIVAVTAFEAYDRRSLRWPTRYIAWIMTGLYLFVAIPGTILIYWHLQYLSPSDNTDTGTTTGKGVSRRDDLSAPPRSCKQAYPFIVLAAGELNDMAAGKFFNLCIIYFCISSANTALYVASRTLYGIFRPLGERQVRALPWWQQFRDLPYYLGMLSSRRVPVAALVVSALSWAWLVGLRAVKFDVLGLMSTIGSIGGVMVWFVECCAYISYFAWLRGTELPDYYDRNARDFQWQRQRPFFSSLQPFVAWFAAFGCVAIAFVLCSAPWWQGDRSRLEIIGVYAGPFLMLALFLVLKARRYWFGSGGATRAQGRQIYLALEDLSGLPLDREPWTTGDDERADRESVVAKITSLLSKKMGPKQGAGVTEREMGTPELTGIISIEGDRPWEWSDREHTTNAYSTPVRKDSSTGRG